MTNVALAHMDSDAFLEWCLDQDGKWELIAGVPVQVDIDPTTGMAGATRNHDTVTINIIAGVGRRLRGGPCRPHTADLASRMTAGNVRRPDVSIDCSRGRPNDLTTAEPTVFFEVLSPSTRSYDFIVKAEEYRHLPTLRHFVLVDPGRAKANVFTRLQDGSWVSHEAIGLEATIELPAVGLSLPLSELYEDAVLDD